MRNRKALLFAAGILLVFGSMVPGDTYTHIEYTCPIDGTIFKSRKALSGYKSGMRLDTRPLGAIAAPWPIPVCPKDHFVVLDYEPEELEKLKSYIPSDAYQAYARQHSASYAFLAKIRHFLGAAPAEVGYAYLQASWEVEDELSKHLGYLELSLRYHLQALEEHPETTEKSIHIELLSAELERRLGRFDVAERRLRRLKEISTRFEDFILGIIDYQIELVGKRDKDPHELPSHE